MAARKGMAIPPPSMDLSEQEEFERFLTEVADGEERNKRREDEQKQKDWEDTKKYLADAKVNRVPSGYGPAVPSAAAAGARTNPVPQAAVPKSTVPPVSPRGGAAAPASVEPTWNRSAPKGSPIAASPQRTAAPPEAQAPRSASPQSVQRVQATVVPTGVTRPPSGAQRALPTSAPPTPPMGSSGSSPVVSPRTSGTQPPLSPRGDIETRRAELEEQKKRLAEMRQRVTENYGKTLIDHLKLAPHPEGGYFREVYRSTENMDKVPARFGGGPRSYATAIYFMLLKGQVSRWHKLKADELWHFYGGLTKYTLGTVITSGESFVLPVPHGVWFAAISKEDKAGWSLVGCTMSPGFDYKDWELANIQQLCAAYPAHADVITALSE